MSAGKAIRLLSYVQAMSFVQSISSLDMYAAKMDTNSSGPLIRQLIFTKNSNSYVLGNNGVAYSRCREILLDALAALGYDSRLFGLHSLRSCNRDGKLAWRHFVRQAIKITWKREI